MDGGLTVWRRLAAVVPLAVGAGLCHGSAAGAYDELAEGPAAEVARLFYSALSLPGVSEWDGAKRAALVDAATLRYRDRLVDRASQPAGDAALRHVERLAAAEAVPAEAVGQACAQAGLASGPCAPHAGYVRRVLVVEEMLVQGQLTLSELERELLGAPRSGLAGAGAPDARRE